MLPSKNILYMAMPKWHAIFQIGMSESPNKITSLLHIIYKFKKYFSIRVLLLLRQIGL